MRSLEAVAAHLVTAVRLVAAPALIWGILGGHHQLALAVFAGAAVSDFFDGWVARRLGTASELGRWFDHLADIGLLLSGYVGLVVVGAAPLWVPLSIAAAFSFYVFDSLRRSTTRSLIASRVGHLSGVLNYAILAGVLIDAGLGGGVIPEVLRSAAFAAVPVYSAAAVIGRLLPGDP